MNLWVEIVIELSVFGSIFMVKFVYDLWREKKSTQANSFANANFFLFSVFQFNGFSSIANFSIQNDNVRYSPQNFSTDVYSPALADDIENLSNRAKMADGEKEEAVNLVSKINFNKYLCVTFSLNRWKFDSWIFCELIDSIV